MYQFSIEWRAGKTHFIADALSRALYFPPDESSEVTIFGVFRDDPALRVIRANIDNEYTNLRHEVRQGNSVCPDRFRGFLAVWPDLRIDDDILVVGDRLVIPGPSRSLIVDGLHESHSGLTKTNTLARQLFFWPHMTNSIAQKIKSCPACVSRLPSLPFEPLLADKADFPMHKIARIFLIWTRPRFLSRLTAIVVIPGYPG